MHGLSQSTTSSSTSVREMAVCTPLSAASQLLAKKHPRMYVQGSTVRTASSIAKRRLCAPTLSSREGKRKAVRHSITRCSKPEARQNVLKPKQAADMLRCCLAARLRLRLNVGNGQGRLRSDCSGHSAAEVDLGGGDSLDTDGPCAQYLSALRRCCRSCSKRGPIVPGAGVSMIRSTGIISMTSFRARPAAQLRQRLSRAQHVRLDKCFVLKVRWSHSGSRSVSAAGAGAHAGFDACKDTAPASTRNGECGMSNVTA